MYLELAHSRVCYEQDSTLSLVSTIFIGPNSLSRVEDFAAVNHVTQAVVRVDSKIGL